MRTKPTGSRILRDTGLLAGFVVAAFGHVAPAISAEPACSKSALAGIAIENASVVDATEMAAGAYAPVAGKPAFEKLPAFCLVRGEARPTADSLIRFEVWMPQGRSWNGKIVATANGGYSSALTYGDMAYALRQGYAVLGGDTGHQIADGNDMTWGAGHPEKIADWGHRANHAILTAARPLVAALGGKAATRAYHYGCSTGGSQGYAMAQRYPGDFDGIIAGAPGSNRVRLTAEFLWRYLANRAANTNRTLLTAAKTTLINKAALAACDAIDGVVDGVISDPSACDTSKFDVRSLKCTGGDTEQCLTEEQVEAARKIYEGPRNPQTGAIVYPGPSVGTEATWPSYWGDTEPSRADFWRLWAFDDKTWNPWTFDFGRDLQRALDKLGPAVDQTNDDLGPFKAHGGKLITYHGLADAVVSAADTTAYYRSVRQKQGGQNAVDGFFRLFLVPGMGHCSGGGSADTFGNAGRQAPEADAGSDLLKALDAWVETARAPTQLVAARMSPDGRVDRTRLLCAYPKKPVFKGTGDPNGADAFECR